MDCNLTLERGVSMMFSRMAGVMLASVIGVVVTNPAHAISSFQPISPGGTYSLLQDTLYQADQIHLGLGTILNPNSGLDNYTFTYGPPTLSGAVDSTTTVKVVGIGFSS